MGACSPSSGPTGRPGPMHSSQAAPRGRSSDTRASPVPSRELVQPVGVGWQGTCGSPSQPLVCPEPSALRDDSDAPPAQSPPGLCCDCGHPRWFKSKIVEGPQSESCVLQLHQPHFKCHGLGLVASRCRVVHHHRKFYWTARLWAQGSESSFWEEALGSCLAPGGARGGGGGHWSRAIQCVSPPPSPPGSASSAVPPWRSATWPLAPPMPTTSLACTVGTWLQPLSSSGKQAAW